VFKREKVEATVKVVNVVASATLGQRVNLDAVVEDFPNARFPSKQFPGIVFRFKKPKTAILIFSSGKIVCTGGKSRSQVRKAVENLVRELSEKGVIVSKMPKVKINNMVASASLGVIDFERIPTLQNTMYEPEQFPAVIYRMENPKVVFLIFPSGRLICAGAKNKEEIHRAIRKLIQQLNNTEASKTFSFDKTIPKGQAELVEGIALSRFKLKDFALSDSQGKACDYIGGLWCSNKLCHGPPCKFAKLILRKLADGSHGCWGFHWQEGWYTQEIKKSQRKYYD